MSEIRVSGPLPPGEGPLWCAACVMLAKQQLHDEHMGKMQAALTDGKAGFMNFPVPGGVHLEEAVTIAVWGDSPQMPPMPVCWTHAAGIKLKARSPLEVPPGSIPLPPGLIKGQG